MQPVSGFLKGRFVSMKLLRNIYSDWIKTKHTPIRLIIFLVPIIYTSLIIWYCSNSVLKGTADYQEYIYFGFFEIMATSFPLAEGLLCALACMQEKNAGGYYNVLSSSSRTTSYMSKFLMIVLMNIFVVFGSIIMLIFGMKFILHVHGIHYSLFLLGALLAVIGALFLITIHLTLGFRFGIGASMAVGGAGFLTAAFIGATNAGDKIWRYVPWAWSSRLTKLIELSMASVETKDGMLVSEYIKTQFVSGFSVIIIATAIILVLNVIWFRSWEGKKSYE